MLFLNSIGSSEFIDAAQKNDMVTLLSVIIIVLIGVIVILSRELKRKYSQSNRMMIEHANKIDDIRDKQMKHEETINKQWSESARETLQVLNGVTNILEMGEKAGKYETEKILEKIENAEKRIIDNLQNTIRKNG